MKILWLNHRDLESPRSGGAERTISEVARRLVNRGHEVTQVVGGWRGADRRATDHGIRIIREGRWLTPHLASVGLALRESFDIIIEDLAHVLPWRVPLRSGTARVAYFRHLHARTLQGQVPRGLAWALKSVERCYPLIYRATPFVTESSTSVRDLIQLGVKPELIERIPPGVNSDLFRPGQIEDSPTFIYFGGLRPYKRPEQAVLALAELHRRGQQGWLWVVGDGPSLDKVRATVRHEGVSEFVEFLGRLKEADLADRVGRSWANIHTSTSEGWCLSAMEAAAAGVPTVAYEVPGLTDSVVKGETGLLVEDGNWQELAIAMAVAARRVGTWRERCRSYALTFDWDRVTDSWESYLTAVSARRGKRTNER